jgi:hypothetical protein
MNLLNVMVSCFGYRDAWPHFKFFIEKHWRGCKIPWATITDKAEGPGIGQVLQVGSDKGWTRNLANGLIQAKQRFPDTKHIVLWQEDFFLTATVQQEAIDEAVRLLDSDPMVGCVRLYPCPGGDPTAMVSTNYGEHKRRVDYRISCQVAIWRYEYLMKILDNEKLDGYPTPREFELDGTEFSNLMKEVVLAWDRQRQPWPVEYLCSAISRGRWSPDAVRYCRENGIEPDLKFRAMEQECKT